MKLSAVCIAVSFITGLVFAAVPLTWAQGTGFTYQGRLTDNGAAANGNYDLQFTICDALTNGNVVAGPIFKPSTAAISGLFTVTLDFGVNVFPGAARWIEIGVRPAGSASAYTALTPRQAITATPYAITASSVTGPINGSLITQASITGSQLVAGAAAANLAAIGQTGVPSGGLVFSLTDNAELRNAGYVRIGTTTTTGETWLGGITCPPPASITPRCGPAAR